MYGTWAYPSLPVYNVRPGPTGDRKTKRTKASKKSKTSDGPVPSSESLPSLPPERPPPPPSHLLTQDIASDFMGPAVDGPPSPESIRALNKQMRRTSVLDKHRSHQTSSSGSSSLRSLTSGGRPSWEHGLEGMSLSRKSSGRSTSSSMPTRERPDSVQIFGRTIFNRRGKLRRETSAQSSSAGSLYSPDVPNETVPAPATALAKEFGAGIFTRRRTLRAEAADATAADRKYQISGPYNFQHVTHTHNDYPSNTRGPGRMGSVSEYSETQFAGFSSEALPLPEGGDLAFLSSRPPSFMPQTSPPRRLLHARSQEQLRAPPPRPPRSPIELDHAANPPVPPPRVSSRVSMRYDGFDPLASTELERPQTSGGFRHPRPFGLLDNATSPPATSHGLPQGSEPDALLEHRMSRVTIRPDNENWPLPSQTSPLPGVPEEEESAIMGRMSRASMASNRSSLRASQSVPLLRQLSLSQSPINPGLRRPPSAASDTLGRLDLIAAQRALKAALMEGNGADEVERESWEDDIDYCYEHEAEADCNFAWDRPSIDMSRDGDTVTPVEADVRPNPTVDVSPVMLSPGQFDTPALSPSSQVSAATVHEAITPTTMLKPSNFSLPRPDGAQSQRYLHVRKSSDASSFKESHGFTLSPSLLIPGDYREQMQAHEADKISPRNTSYPAPYEEPTLTMDKSALLIYPRTSASTTGSNETDRSQYSERHISTTSASTDFTRLTMSTSSLDMENFIPKPEIEVMPPPVPHAQLEEFPAVHARAKSQGNIMPSLPESDEAVPDRPGLLSHRDLSASDPNLVRLANRSPFKRSKEPLLTRRRARTTSLSTPPPPGQYALFPTVQMSGSRI